MTGFSIRENSLYADDIPVNTLAEQYGTPLYVYSASLMKDNFLNLSKALNASLGKDANPLIAYACKANTNLAVMNLFGSLGGGADVVSGGELTRAIKAGIPADRIVFSGVGKTDEEIKLALNTDILQINVESKPECERIAHVAQSLGKTARIAFRLNPNVDAGTHAKITTGKAENKFGIPDEEIFELYQYATDHSHLDPVGISMHIGSQLTKLDPYRSAFSKLKDFVLELRSKGFSVRNLDLGGGVGVRYYDEVRINLDEYAALITEILGDLGVRFIFEPGRYLTAEAGALLSRVVYIKEGKAKKFAIIDAGMNDLLRPTLYEAFHNVQAAENNERPEETYDIVGPVCETGDTFLKNHNMPQISAGDVVAIMTSGAYGACMASGYNARDIPAEVLVDGSRHELIRKPLTVHDMMEKESIPSWLESDEKDKIQLCSAS